jgi:hypothetical protein
MIHQSSEREGQEILFTVPDAEPRRFASHGGQSIAERSAATEQASHRVDAFADLGGRPSAPIEHDVPTDEMPQTTSVVTPLRPRRRRGIGPNHGEDALPHVDQRLDPDAVKAFEDGIRKAHQILAAIATEKVVGLPESDSRSRALKRKRMDELNG